MVAPSIRSVMPSTQDSATSIDFLKPDTIVEGDVLLLIVGLDDSNSQVDSIYTPSGWMQKIQIGNGDMDVRLGLFVKEATGSESTLQNVAMDGPADNWAGFYMAIQDADIDKIVADTVGNVQNSVRSLAAPSITTTDNDSLIISATSTDGWDMLPYTVSGIDWPSTLPGAQTAYAGSSAGSGVGVGYITRTLATAGASNDLTWEYDRTDGANAVQIAFGPAGGVSWAGSFVRTASGSKARVRMPNGDAASVRLSDGSRL